MQPIEKKYNILLVDDHKQFLDGLEIFLTRDGNYNIINKFLSGTELLKSNQIAEADVILLDIEMPEMNGKETAKEILSEYPDKKLLAVTLYKEKIYLFDLVSIGFKGCVFKDEIHIKLKTAIKEIIKGNLYFPESIAIK
ncbi:MAG TPA: response regulator transcription factor [Bacteroidales bacterium]